MGTQWRRGGMAAVPLGLDYAALPAVCAALGHTLDAALFHRVRTAEAAALGVMLAERR